MGVARNKIPGAQLQMMVNIPEMFHRLWLSYLSSYVRHNITWLMYYTEIHKGL
jgi:hypothetical protein